MASSGRVSSFSQTISGLLLLLAFTVANGKVSLYESENFVGLLTETNSTETCANLPSRFRNKASSLKTDSCIIAYTGENCTLTSIKIHSGLYTNLTANISHAYNQHFSKAIQSFHSCSDSLTHVSFYKEKELISEYKNFCGCLSLPSITDAATKLDNHGTCVNLYLDQFGVAPSCTGTPVQILGGKSYIAENLRNITHSQNSWKRIVAITPCLETSQMSAHCTRLTAVVTKFEVSVDTAMASVMSSTTSITMAVTNTFRNNGTAIVSEEYTASKSVTESTETTLTSSFYIFENWTVETGVSTEFSADVPLVSKSTVTASLTSAYNRIENSSIEETHVKRQETITQYSVSQKISIEPCSVYDVNSFVRMVNNYPVNYKVYAKIQGLLGNRKMLAEEIREHLDDDMKWQENLDEYTIVAVGQGQMTVDYGLETVIDGAGHPIKGCETKEKKIPESQREIRAETNSAVISELSQFFLALSSYLIYLNFYNV